MTNTLDVHLAAIAGRDLDGYAATLHDDVIVVLPNGSLIQGRDAVLDFHREWFKDLDWSQEMSMVSVVETETTLVGVYEADYRDGPLHKRNLVSLVFTLVDGSWLLLHDQNTPLAVQGNA